MAFGDVGTDQVLRVSSLCKRYGSTPVLRDLSLQVYRGAVHGLVGLNGSGKTTSLECILGLQGFDSGQIEVLQLAPTALHRAGGRIVGIFDSPSLNPELTVRQTLEHARLYCRNPVRSPAELEALLGISAYSDYRIRQLSLGNRRRASIAQALVGKPELIILDEPFNGLDAGGVEEVLALITRLNREEDCSFLLSSHQLPYLEQICSHLAILHAGSILLSDRVDQLLASNQPGLFIRCSQPLAARELLQEIPGVEVEVSPAVDQPENDLLHIRPGSNQPGAINSLLVRAGFTVSELRQEQASLTALFHRLVASGNTGPEQGK